MIMNILNESVTTTTQSLPEMDIFGAGIIAIIGIIALILVVRFFLKRRENKMREEEKEAKKSKKE
jgi:flagellar biosynthesis/type III secretory pathway M-ring protein FliF/YscJ